MSRHTPGPWEAYDNPGNFGRNKGWFVLSPKTAEGQRYVVADCRAYVGHLEEPNARLIAASPELYEVADLVVQIKQLSEELGAMSEEEQESRGHLVYAKRTGLNAALWGKAEAAIVKVEGHK